MSWNDLIGRQLGQFTILDELGRGGSSRVYRARDAETQRDVAIKVIPNDAEDRVGFVRRFEREVQAVAKLNHPNVVSVFDRGETDDLVYLVMQCVTGGTLRQRLGRPLPVGVAAALIIQVALALHHAHLHGIIHRDVKPSNMLIDSTNPNYLLLTDFGIAKLQGTRGLTKTGTTIGTPEYMSPEQAEGKEIDPRADVYSLGCVLYETLAGRPPFTGSTPVSVLYQQVHSRPAYLRGFNPDVPRELIRVLEQALAKRPESRFGTADGLAQALYPFADESLPAFLPRPATTGALHPQFAPPVSEPLPAPPADVEQSRVMSLSPLPMPLPPLASLADVSEPDAVGHQPNADVSAQSPVDTALQRAPATGKLADLHPAGGGPPVASSSLKGLGAEGLDAIFPDDPEAQTPRNIYQATQRATVSGRLSPRVSRPHDPIPPGSPGQPSLPGFASMTGGLSTPGQPSLPSQPGVSGMPERAGGSGRLDAFHTPGMPSTPSTPGTPGAPGGAASASQPAPTTRQPGQPSQTSRPRATYGSQTIPLPAFRLPAKKTRPLHDPLADDGELDIEALMAQVESRLPPPSTPAPPATSHESVPPPSRGSVEPDFPPIPRFTGAPTAGAPPYEPHRPLTDEPYGGPWGNPYAVRSTPPAQESAKEQRRSESVEAFRRAIAETGGIRAADPVWRPELEVAPEPVRERAQRLMPVRMYMARWMPSRVSRDQLLVGTVVSVLLIVSLVSWLLLSASGLLTPGRAKPPHPVAKATATFTALPTATLTPAPTATSTTNPQADLDRQAAASFRAIALATYDDQSCSVANSSFGGGQAIFVNLCVADSGVPGPVTVAIRQGGQVVYTLVNGQYFSAGSHYWYSRYGVPAGSYDMLITVQINGQTATARDIPFTVS